jgi:hypothetical protein
MKKLALISSHCDTPEKINILKSNIKTLKSLNIDTFVISAIKVDIDCDFLFITKENPILKWPERAIATWKVLNYDEKVLKLVSLISDYGWASLYQIKKIMEFGSTYDYDIFYFLIYDLKIDERIIEDINLNISNTIYPRKDFNTDNIYPSSLHFAIFNKEKLKVFSSLLNKEVYLKIKDGVAEDFVHQCAISIGINHSDYPVIDLICMTDSDKLFNQSISEKYEFFLNKDEDSNFKIFFSTINDELTVYINNEIYKITQPQLIETNIPCENLKLLKIENNEGIIDYITEYDKTNKRLIYFE